ncbi:hypothetical protein EV179_005731, partial [Coemansia sp. RSA 487]
MIAELSQEEVESIQRLVNQNYGKTNLVRLRQLIRDTHPLCAERDLQDAMVECISKCKTYQDTMPGSVKPEPMGHRYPGHQIQLKPQYPQQEMYQEKPYGVVKNYLTDQNAGLTNVVFAKDQPISHKIFSTEDPACILASRWTDEETDKLKEYLDMTQGRKDWTKCARHVGTKSNAQCKA